MAAGQGVNASVNVSSVNTIKPNNVSNAGGTPSARTTPKGFVGPYAPTMEMDFSEITTEGLEEAKNYRLTTVDSIMVEPELLEIMSQNKTTEENIWEILKGTGSWIVDRFDRLNTGIKDIIDTFLFGNKDEIGATTVDAGAKSVSSFASAVMNMLASFMEFAAYTWNDSIEPTDYEETEEEKIAYDEKKAEAMEWLTSRVPELEEKFYNQKLSNGLTMREYIEKYSSVNEEVGQVIEGVFGMLPSLIASLILEEYGAVEGAEILTSIMDKMATFVPTYSTVYGQQYSVYISKMSDEDANTIEQYIRLSGPMSKEDAEDLLRQIKQVYVFSDTEEKQILEALQRGMNDTEISTLIGKLKSGMSSAEASRCANIDAFISAMIETFSGGIGGTKEENIIKAIFGEIGEESLEFWLTPFSDYLKRGNYDSVDDILNEYVKFINNPEARAQEWGDTVVTTAATVVALRGGKNSIQIFNNYINNLNNIINTIQSEKVTTETLQGILENSEFNKTNLVNGIIDTLPANLDDATKARMIYLKLNQVFTYSDEYLALTNQIGTRDFDKIATYENPNIDITNVSRNSIVCMEWAQIYAELLEKAGIPKNSIHIYGKGTTGHQFVTVDLANGNVIFADGTMTSGEVSDMALAKFGEQTNNFKIYDKNHAAKFADYVEKYNQLIIAEKMFYGTEKSISLEKIDKKIGYNTKDYESDFKTITSNYSNQEVSLNNRIDGFVKLMNSDNYSTSDMFNISRSYKDTFFPQNQCRYISSTLYITSNNDAINVISITDQNGKKSYIYKINTGDAIYTDNIDGIIPNNSRELTSW